jgi:hypothetical protein
MRSLSEVAQKSLWVVALATTLTADNRAALAAEVPHPKQYSLKFRSRP